MTDQIILAVDINGKFLEYIPKEAGHKGKGRRHLAIAVLIFDSRNQVLLQKRKHKIFDDIWDLTGATHPLHQKDGSDETLEEATRRSLKEEFGISEKIILKNLGFFNYFAEYGDYCENEHCAMMVGRYDGEIALNPKAGYEYQWVDKNLFLEDLKVNPKKYTPWAIEGASFLHQDLDRV